MVHACQLVTSEVLNMQIARRNLLAGSLAAPFVLSARPSRAATTIRMGTLKLIHAITPYFYQRFAPEGVTVEVIPFENPGDGKDAVMSGSVDFGTFGIAAAIFGASMRQPIVVIASECNKGMAIVAGKNSGIDTLKQIRGKRVAIWPGSTQEVFMLDRLQMEGMTIHDITPVRVSFSEMHAALARGDVDAYVGAEPAPSVSVTTGVGKIVEYPYSTPMGSLNMIIATSRDTVTNRPELAQTIVTLQRKASAYATAHPDEMAAMTVSKLGMSKPAVEASIPNVELNWQMTPQMIAEAKTYADRMLAMKQIKALPDFATLFDTRFSDAAAHAT
jgi:ABC-type nitrate/sulfonate/bicarbonate transport system substrate-binding protein